MPALELPSFAALHQLALPIAIAALLLLSACGVAPSEEKSTPTIDVPPALEVDIENDPVATPRGPELVGILPGDFPSSFNLHLPASLVDFGGQGRGSRWVEILTNESQATVRAAYESRRNAGWQVSSSGNGLSLTRGNDSVILEFKPASAGTVYRLHY